MSIELQRWKCPNCGGVADVWFEDGKPEVEMVHLHTAAGCHDVNAKTICHACFSGGFLVELVFDAEETGMLG